MRIADAGGGGTAAPMTIAEEMALLKRHIAQERVRQATQQRQETEAAEAADDTGGTRETAEDALDDYQEAVEAHQNDWADDHRGEYSTQEAALAAWQADWEASEEGQQAWRTLVPHLAAYSQAAQTELRLAAEHAGGSVETAIEQKAEEISGRETGGGWKDEVLDGLVDSAAEQVAGESPELRGAILDATEALDELDAAQTDLQAIEDSKAEALDNAPPNAWFRQEIGDSYQPQLSAARERVAEAETAVSQALDREFAIILSENALAGAEDGMDSLSDLPGGLRNAELPYANAALGEARQQYQDVLNGDIDLTHFTSSQVDEAVQAVFANHLQLADSDNQGFAAALFVRGEALKLRPEIETNLATLSVDENTPDWMRALIEDKGDEVTAAVIVSMGVADAVPANEAEEILARDDPMAFAILKYAGETFEPPDSTVDNVQPTEAGLLALGQEAAAEAFETLVESDPDKAGRLQLLMLASGDVRTDYVEQAWQRLVAEETPEQSVDQMLDEYLDEEDFNNPDWEPTTGIGRFMQVLNVNMAASFTPGQQAQIWDAVGGDVTSYINQQASHIESEYGGDDFYAAAVGEWLKQMGQSAAPPVAGALIDATVARFDPSLIGQHGGGRMVDGLQIVADRAPQSAGKLAEWATAPTGDNGLPVPLTDLVSVKKDGTGAALGQAILNEMRFDGADEYAIENLQSYYDAGLEAAQENQREEQASQQFELFNSNRNEKLQDIFDSAIDGTGDLYTARHNFGADPETDNEIGRAMNLTPDNPDAGPGEALYTDPDKLARIHEVKQINMIGDALRLEPDNPDAPLGEAKYTDPDKLAQINQVRGWVVDIGGEDAVLTFTPAVYASANYGVQTLFLIRVEGDKNNDGVITRDETTRPSGRGRSTEHLDDEDMIIDASVVAQAVGGQNVAWKYNDFGDFQKDNMLDDDGRLYMASSPDMLLRDVDGDGHVDNINFEGVDAAITTTWEHVRRWGDVVIGVAGLAAGVALTIGTGGLAAPVVAGAAALWFGYRTIETADEMSDHGQSFNPINTRAEGAWFGVIDPTAGGFWLGTAATVTGFAALRPVALAGRLGQLGRGATIADEALLARTGLNSTQLSRNLGTDLFLKNGLQTKIYRAQLAEVNRLVSGGAMVSGGALVAGQAQDFYHMAANGQLDLTDWSIDSASWDFALMGGGAASMGAGIAAARARRPGPYTQPDGRVTLWAHRQSDGSYLFNRIGADGRLTPDVFDGIPADVVILETSLGDNGAPVTENVHFFSRNRDGSYRASNLVDEGMALSDLAVFGAMPPPGTADRPHGGEDDDIIRASRNADGSYTITTLESRPDGGRPGSGGLDRHGDASSAEDVQRGDVPSRGLATWQDGIDPRTIQPTGGRDAVSAPAALQPQDPLATVSGRVDAQFRGRLAAHVRSKDGIPFAEFMELSLYGIEGEGGYYQSGLATIGDPSVNDFITAPERSRYFGATIARAVVDMYRAMGSPERFDIVEMGAGNGTMARDILETLQADHPEIYQAVRYTIVERAQGLIARQQQTLADQPVQWLHASTDALPMRNVRGLLLSNELVDAFPVHRAVIRQGEIREIFVTLDERGRFVETERDPSPELAAVLPELDRLFAPSSLGEGQQLTVNARAMHWMRGAAGALDEGYVLTFDYGQPGATMQPPHAYYRETLPIQRAYDDPGAIDITTHVDNTVLSEVGAQVGLEPATALGARWIDSQRDFLLRHGLREALQAETDAGARGNALRLLGQDYDGFFVLLQQKRGPAPATQSKEAAEPPPVPQRSDGGDDPDLSVTRMSWRPRGPVPPGWPGPKPDGPTLVVGGGRAYRPPAEGEVFLDIDPRVSPHIQSDIRRSGLRDGSFAEVLFEYTEKGPAALAEAHRVLMPGGRVRVLTAGHPANVQRTLRDVEAAGFRLIPGDYPVGGEAVIVAAKPAAPAPAAGRQRPRVLVEDPETGQVVEAEVLLRDPGRLEPFKNANGVIGSEHIRGPESPSLRDHPDAPGLNLVRDPETGTYALLPVVAGGAPTLGERLQAVGYDLSALPAQERTALIGTATAPDMAAAVRGSDEAKGASIHADAIYDGLGAFVLRPADPETRLQRLATLLSDTGDIAAVSDDFGPALTGSYRDAAPRLEALAGGEAVVARHPDLGPIALAWGDRDHGLHGRARSGYGLVRMVDYYPGAVADLPALIEAAQFRGQPPAPGDTVAHLRSGAYDINLVKATEFQGHGDTWMITTVHRPGHRRLSAHRLSVSELFALAHPEIDGGYFNPTNTHLAGREKPGWWNWKQRKDRKKLKLRQQIDVKGARAPSMDDVYRLLMGDAAALPGAPNRLTWQSVQLAERLNPVLDIAHDGNARPEGYDRRRGGRRVVNNELHRLATRPGPFTEMFVSSVGPGLGVGHAASPTALKGTYRGAPGLDKRHVRHHGALGRNLAQWRRHMIDAVEALSLAYPPDEAVAIVRNLDEAVWRGEGFNEAFNAFQRAFGRAQRHIDNRLPDHARFRKLDGKVQKLADQDPYLALTVHLAVAGGDPASFDTVLRVFNRNREGYHDIAGVGEVVLYDSLLTPLLDASAPLRKGQGFDFADPEHVQSAFLLLAVQQAYGKPSMVRSAWATARTRETIATGQPGDRRPMVTRDHAYDRFNAVMDLIAPFAQDVDSGVILWGAGTDHFVKPNFEGVDRSRAEQHLAGTGSRLRDRDAFLDDIFSGYGGEIPLHILKMEEALAVAPGVKFDLSANIREFNETPAATDALITFMRRHPGSVIAGSGATKPENVGQYTQVPLDFMPLVARLGASGPDGPRLVHNLLRGNLEAVMDRAVGIDPATGRFRDPAAIRDDIAGTFDVMAQELGAPHPADHYLTPIRDRLAADGSRLERTVGHLSRFGQEIGRTRPGRFAPGDIHTLVHEGHTQSIAGQDIRLVHGRRQNRAQAEAELAAIDHPAYQTIAELLDHPLVASLWQDAGAQQPDFSGAVLPDRRDLIAQPPLARLRAEPGTPKADSNQQGLAAGAEWDNRRRAAAASGADATTALGSGVMVGLEAPYALLIMSGSQAVLNHMAVVRRQFARKLYEEVTEDGQVTEHTLDLMVSRYVDLGREAGLPAEALAAYVHEMGQLRANLRYLHTATQDWPAAVAGLRHSLFMRAIGDAEVRGNEALGLQVSGLSANDPRTRRGRASDSAISFTQGGVISAVWDGLPATLNTIESLPLPPQWKAGLTVTAWIAAVTSSGGQGLGAVRKQWTNYRGRRNASPELTVPPHLEPEILRLAETGQVGYFLIELGKAVAGGDVSLENARGIVYALNAVITDRKRRDETRRTVTDKGRRKPPSEEAESRRSAATREGGASGRGGTETGLLQQLIDWISNA